jgi:hypothetical protein
MRRALARRGCRSQQAKDGQCECRRLLDAALKDE